MLTQSTDKPHVILIHGIASNRSTMWPLAWWIRRAGYSTHCYGYASCWRDLDYHGSRFREFLHQQSEQNPNLYIVAHSMGGIVTRRALTLEQGCPDFVRRVLMLSTPQLGSPNATWLSRRGLGFIKTLSQLSDSPDSYVNCLPQIEGTEIGTIAASYDFVVSEESGHVEGEVDYVKPFSGHNGLLVRPKVAKLAVNFLDSGKF